MPNLSETERGFRPQLHYFVMLLVWLLITGMVLLYFYFVKANIWRPHVVWWLLTFGSIIGSVLLAGWLVLRRIWHRSHRTWSIGIFMLTVAPLVFFGGFIWLVFSLNQVRGDLQLSLPVRAFGIWAGDFFELEARRQYPRVTRGMHVQLFHDNDEHAKVLVEKMDKRIRDMANTLETDPSSWKVAWVRGELFGLKGRTVGLWSICKSPIRSTAGLGRLDRHEVAHAAITSLCEIDQEPPMLLAEGWAVSQSDPFGPTIERLLDLKTQNQHQSIIDLVSDQHYGRSVGPAYHHGGPLVFFLLERFGGKKFLELYGQVRRPTFLADAERVLGVTWRKVDTEFWQWLEEQGDKLNETRSGGLPPLTFADESLKSLWEKICTAAIEYERQVLLDRPGRFGLEIVEQQSNSTERLHAVFDGQQGWLVTARDDLKYGTTYAQRCDASGSFFAVESAKDGSFNSCVNLSRNDLTIYNLFKRVNNRIRPIQLRNAFIVDIIDTDAASNWDVQLMIVDIVPGKTVDAAWQLVIKESWEGSEIGTTEFRLDPSRGFDIVEESVELDSSTYDTHFEHGPFLGGQLAVKETRSGDWRTKSGTRKLTSVSTVRELNDAEIDALTKRVQAVSEKVRAKPQRTLKDLIVNPFTLAFGWPILAFLILGIDWVGDRVKIKVQ